MMRSLIYLLIGIFFGITMFKSEAASWFRIYEMFKFDAFHMYGIIGTAVVLGVLIVQVIKRFKIKSFYGEPIEFQPKLQARLQARGCTAFSGINSRIDPYRSSRRIAPRAVTKRISLR